MYFYDPLLKQQSSQWIRNAEPTPVVQKRARSVTKVLATVFWDKDGIFFIEYLPNNTTIEGPYYCNVLTKLTYSIRNKRRDKLSGAICFLHETVSAHRSDVVKSLISLTDMIVLDHIPYSPDLALSGYYVSKFKKDLKGSEIF